MIVLVILSYRLSILNNFGVAVEFAGFRFFAGVLRLFTGLRADVLVYSWWLLFLLCWDTRWVLGSSLSSSIVLGLDCRIPWSSSASFCRMTDCSLLLLLNPRLCLWVLLSEFGLRNQANSAVWIENGAGRNIRRFLANFQIPVDIHRFPALFFVQPVLLPNINPDSIRRNPKPQFGSCLWYLFLK